ncbi:hypothetical protein [Planococcus sp. ISL-109]|uniref:hypothetical protein n=1 Tax=Planococcus sp. ISL-109 TaxID=2819166 RepID=UPI001BE55C3B|nr:hypothetical protein [Planococcus sp. ISL-109]MBT2581274.1 hypothetical protein [Planococcus sp. ISL-109]
MNQTHSRKNDNRKMLPYLVLLVFTSFIIAHLNIFPGAVSFEQVREGITITQGSIEKSTVTVNVEDYETSDWLRLIAMETDINTLQQYLAFISLLIPVSLYFIIEHKRIKLFHLSAKVKLISFASVFLLLYLALAFGYVEVLERIDENLAVILG